VKNELFMLIVTQKGRFTVYRSVEFCKQQEDELFSWGGNTAVSQVVCRITPFRTTLPGQVPEM
jgi:hypothetical protein